MADLLGVTRPAISTWKAKGTSPKGETVAAAAAALGVSADYLLFRTDDPTDFSKVKLAEPPTQEQEQDVKKAPAAAEAQEADLTLEKMPYILSLYNRLDFTDRVRIEAYIEGILTGEKYNSKKRAIS